jgi:very-short-patch-repair endonuclease
MLPRSPDGRATLVASGQAGLVSQAQLLAAGLTPSQITYRVRTGALVRIAPGVYRIAGVPKTPDQAEWCAYLWARGNGVLVLGCAARCWGFRGFEDDQVSEGIMEGSSHVNLPFKVHRFGRDTLMHVTLRGPFRVTTIPKTVMDLLGRRDHRAKRMLDRSLIDRSCTLADYWFLHDDPEMRWHRGRAILREWLDLRGHRPPNETKGERTLWRLMEKARRFQLPNRQVWVTFPGGRRARFDFAYPDLLFAIEVDEYESHAEEITFSGDRWRDADSALAGWFVLRIPDFDIYQNPSAVLDMIAAHVDRLSRRVG